MINVLVVEDEIPILRNVCNMIEKTNEHFQVKFKADNGEVALEIINENAHSIDLIFLDIHMPVMDGIELLARLKAENINIPTVILSGYQDFNYVRESMRHGVIDYLLKPINLEMLAKVLCLAENKIIALSQQQHSSFAVKPPSGENYGVALVYFGGKNLSHKKRALGLTLNKEQKTLMQKFEKYLSEKLSENEYWIVKDNFIPEWYVVFKAFNMSTQTILKSFCNECTAENAEISILLDDQFCSKASLYEKHAQMSENIKFIMKIGESCFCYGSVQSDYLKTVEMLEQLKKKILSAGFPEEVGGIVNATLKMAQQRREVIVELLKTALLYYSNRFPVNKTYDVALEEMYIAIEDSNNFENLLINIDNWLLKTFNINDRSDKKRKLAIEIKEYLDDNLTEQITTQSIADKFGFVPDYVRSIFVKEYSITPMQYVLNIRIRETKRLLIEKPTLSFKDISAMVGYQDMSYFSKVFKKSEGISPLAYRKNNQKL